MTDLELEQLRREKWRLDGKPVRTIEDARAFIESVGFCLLYPMKPAVLAPTLIGAWVGADEKLPTWQHAFADPRTRDASDLMVRLLREKAAFEANPFDENNGLLVAASVFPFFYALGGERNPKLAPKAGPRSPYSQLACDAFEVIREDGPISRQKSARSWAAAFRMPRSTVASVNSGRSCELHAWTITAPKVLPGMCCIDGRRKQ